MYTTYLAVVLFTSFLFKYSSASGIHKKMCDPNTPPEEMEDVKAMVTNFETCMSTELVSVMFHQLFLIFRA